MFWMNICEKKQEGNVDIFVVRLEITVLNILNGSVHKV
jgi:hypothetical protein